MKGSETMEEWISQNEYMKRYKLGFTVMKQMIVNKEVEVRETPRRKIQNKSWWRHCVKAIIWRDFAKSSRGRNKIKKCGSNTAIVKECEHKWITKKNTSEQRQS